MISNIQRFCIHDGSGIRTTVFFKGCPLRCAWCANPETQHSFPELMIHHNRCRKCMSCIKACPKEALSFRDGSGTVLLPWALWELLDGRIKDGKTGLVTPTQEKNLFVTMDESRLKRLLLVKEEQT